MSFAMDSELQGFDLHPPVLRKNQPLPPLPSPPNITSRFLANIKSKFFKIRQRAVAWAAARTAARAAAKKNAKAADGPKQEASEEDTVSESFITL